MIDEPFEPPLADRLPLELPPPPALRADTLAAVRGAIEIADLRKIRGPFQRAVERVRPAVIRTAKLRR